MSKLYRKALVALVVSALGHVIGCAATGGERLAPATEFSSERIVNADVVNVRTAAARVLRRHFRIDPAASTQTRLLSEPVEVEGRGETARVRDVLTLSPNRQRRIAEIRLVPEGGGVVVQSRVQIQRFDASERAAFAMQRGDDRPAETTTDRRPMIAAGRQEEWVDINRDRDLEREILEDIKNQFADTQPADALQ